MWLVTSLGMGIAPRRATLMPTSAGLPGPTVIREYRGSEGRAPRSPCPLLRLAPMIGIAWPYFRPFPNFASRTAITSRTSRAASALVFPLSKGGQVSLTSNPTSRGAKGSMFAFT
jgi:hypothetical protein